MPIIRKIINSSHKLTPIFTGKQTLRGIVPPADLNEVLRVFTKAVEEVKFAHQKLNETKCSDEGNPTYLTRVMVITLHLACLLLRLMEDSPKTDHQQIRKAIYNFVTLDIKAKKGRRLLHLACCQDASLQWTYPACQFPSSQLAEIILEFGRFDFFLLLLFGLEEHEIC